MRNAVLDLAVAGAHPADGQQHHQADAERRARAAAATTSISIGFILALWSGSRALNVFVDTITIMYGLGGHRGIVRTRVLSFSLYVLGLITGVISDPAGAGRADPGRRTCCPTGSTFINALYWPTVVVLVHLLPGHALPRVGAGADVVALQPARARRSPCSAGSFGSALLRWCLIGTAQESTSIYGPLAAPDRGAAVALPALDRRADRRRAQRVLRPAVAAEGDRARPGWSWSAGSSLDAVLPWRSSTVARHRRRRASRADDPDGEEPPRRGGRRITTCARRVPVVHFRREGDPFVSGRCVSPGQDSGSDASYGVETGVPSCSPTTGEARASYGGRMLAEIARDRSRAPAAGDWVPAHAGPTAASRRGVPDLPTGPGARLPAPVNAGHVTLHRQWRARRCHRAMLAAWET